MSDQTARRDARSASAQMVSFGRFRVRIGQRVILDEDRPDKLGSRATAILLLLLEQAGELVTKAEIAVRVWPESLLEEATLRVHVAALRRCLGERSDGQRFIATVTGRGYQFVHQLSAPEPHRPDQPATPVTPERFALPRTNHRLIGRERVIDAVTRVLDRHGFVTIVGVGGIGKSTVALALAGGSKNCSMIASG